MRKILIVIRREYIQIVRTKGFIIGTILGPVFMAAFIVVPVALQYVSVDKQETIGVIDESRMVFAELDKHLDQKLKDGTRRYVLESYQVETDLESLRQGLNKKILDKELTAYIYIPENIAEGGIAEYASENVSDLDKRENLKNAISTIIIERRLSREGLDPAQITEYIKPVGLTTTKVTKRGTERDTGGEFVFSYFLVLILYATVILYGQIILRGVIEEKSSRVVEIVLSSFRPFQLMAGKILGIAAVGLTQYSVWAIFGALAFRYSHPLISSVLPAAQGLTMPSFPAHIFIYFIIFFVLGYFLFGTIYAAIGSMVNSEKEAQNLVMPVTMLLVLPLLLIMFVMKSPDGSLSILLSLIPFFAPILMFLRICILTPPFLQIFLSIVLMALTTVLMIWIAAKIYRVGILMHGKRPGLAEIIKWLKYS